LCQFYQQQHLNFSNSKSMRISDVQGTNLARFSTVFFDSRAYRLHLDCCCCHCWRFRMLSVRIGTGHDGRSLSSHCWRMDPSTGNWQAPRARGHLGGHLVPPGATWVKCKIVCGSTGFTWHGQQILVSDGTWIFERSEIIVRKSNPNLLWTESCNKQSGI
jgi:hypothetical protein